MPAKRKQPKRKSKFGNVRTVTDGIKHASKKQAMRWVLLRQWEREGKIKNLRREVTYKILVKGEKICSYRADHVYLELARQRDITGMTYYGYEEVVEDVKGMLTPIYRLKKKLMKAVHGIEIREV